MSKKFCSARFKKEQLKSKFERLKEDWAELHKENQASWESLKSKSGEALRTAKKKHE
jgi:hypothetical protein